MKRIDPLFGTGTEDSPYELAEVASTSSYVRPTLADRIAPGPTTSGQRASRRSAWKSVPTWKKVSGSEGRASSGEELVQGVDRAREWILKEIEQEAADVESDKENEAVSSGSDSYRTLAERIEESPVMVPDPSPLQVPPRFVGPRRDMHPSMLDDDISSPIWERMQRTYPTGGRGVGYGLTESDEEDLNKEWDGDDHEGFVDNL